MPPSSETSSASSPDLVIGVRGISIRPTNHVVLVHLPKEKVTNKVKPPTGSCTLRYPKRPEKIQEWNYTICLGCQLHDGAILAHVHNLHCELIGRRGRRHPSRVMVRRGVVVMRRPRRRHHVIVVAGLLFKMPKFLQFPCRDRIPCRLIHWKQSEKSKPSL